jgi:hypothetical protein
MQPNTGDIGDIATTCFEISFIAIKRSIHGDGLPIVTIAISTNAGNATSAILCLPEIESIAAIGLFEIVGVTDCLRPIAALPVRHTQDPGTSRLVASVSQTNARADLCEHGLLGHREFQAGRPRF